MSSSGGGVVTMANVKAQGYSSLGTLAIDEAEVRWTPRGGGGGKRVSKKELASATWTVFGKYATCCLADAEGDTRLRVEGFSKKDRARLAEALSTRLGRALEDRDFASTGRPCGRPGFEGSRLVLYPPAGWGRKVKDTTEEGEEAVETPLFEVDVRGVSQCVLPSGVGAKASEPKEVTMQFVENDAGDDADEHQLVELRLFVPPEVDGTRAAGLFDDDDDPEADQGQRVDEEEDGSTKTPAAQKLQEHIMKRSKMRTVTGDMLAEFAADDGTFLLPRGKYAIDLYGAFFRMHGAQYDYKILYNDVERFILLPKNDDVHYVFVIALDRPIRQGQQRYQYLVWQLSKRADAAVDVNLSEADIDDRFGPGSGLKPSLEGPFYQLVARVFKVLSGKKVYTVGKFRTTDGRHAVPCSVKAKTGQLYPLERSFVFVHQPTLVLRFEDVASVEFERFSGYGQGSATRNFDLRVTMKAFGGSSSSDAAKGGGGTEEHVFTSIERSEYKPLLDFLGTKNLKIRNFAQAEQAARKNVSEILGDDDDDDDDVRDDAAAGRLRRWSRLVDDDRGEAESAESRSRTENDDVVRRLMGGGEADLFRLLAREWRPDRRWLVVGGRGSGSTWHRDPNRTSAYNALLAGRKRWFFSKRAPPGAHPSADGLDVATPVSVVDWYLAFYERAKNDNVLLEAVAGAGDVVYVPSGWYHAVLNLEFSVAVTENFCAPRCLPATLAFLRDAPHLVSGLNHAPRSSGDAAGGGGGDDDDDKAALGRAFRAHFIRALRTHRPRLLADALTTLDAKTNLWTKLTSSSTPADAVFFSQSRRSIAEDGGSPPVLLSGAAAAAAEEDHHEATARKRPRGVAEPFAFGFVIDGGDDAPTESSETGRTRP